MLYLQLLFVLSVIAFVLLLTVGDDLSGILNAALDTFHPTARILRALHKRLNRH